MSYDAGKLWDNCARPSRGLLPGGARSTFCDMSGPARPLGFRSRHWRHAVAGMILLVAISYLALSLLIRSGLGERLVRRELARAVATVTDSAYRVDVESVRFGWGLQNITIEKLVLTRTDSVGTVTKTAAVEVLYVRDIHWLSTVLRKPAVDEVDARMSDLSFTLDFIKSGADSAETVERDSTHPGVDIGVNIIRLLGDTVTVTNQTAAGRQAIILYDVNLELEGLERGQPWTPGYVLSNSDVALTVRSVHASFEDSVYAMDLEGVAANSRDSTLSVESMRVAPKVSDSAFVWRQEYRRDRIDMAAKRAAARSVDFDAALRQGSLRAEVIVVDSLGIDVFSDHRIPARTVAQPRPLLTERIRDLPIRIAVDSVAVRDGRVIYSERAHDGENPGTLRFDGVTGSVINLSNDPDHTAPTTPLMARAQGLLMGATRMAAELSIPLLSPTLDLSYRASVGPVRADIVNEVLIPLEGIEFVRGEVDTLWLDVSATNGVSDGAIHMKYRDLAIRTVDKNSGQQNLGRVLESAVANLLLIHQNNPSQPNREPRLGQVSYARRNQDTLWSFLWFGIRSGLLSLIVGDGRVAGGGQ